MLSLTFVSCQKETITTKEEQRMEENETIQAKFTGAAIDPTNMFLTSAGIIHNQLMEDIRAAYPNGADFSVTPVEDVTYTYTSTYFSAWGSIGSQTDVDVLEYIDDYHYCRHHRPRYLYSKGAFNSEANDILSDVNGSTTLPTFDKQILASLMQAAKTYIQNSNSTDFQNTLTSLKAQINNGMEEKKVNVIANNPLAKAGNKSLVVLGIAQEALNYHLTHPSNAGGNTEADELRGVVPLVLGSTFGAIITTLKLTDQESLKALGGVINGAVQSSAFMELDIN